MPIVGERASRRYDVCNFSEEKNLGARHLAPISHLRSPSAIPTVRVRTITTPRLAVLSDDIHTVAFRFIEFNTIVCVCARVPSHREKKGEKNIEIHV